MTRFARAKGSKSSNEKLREEATPWQVMKQQLNESLSREKSSESKEKTKTARQLLEEKEKSSPATNDWAEFDKSASKKTKLSNSSKIEKPIEKKIKKKKLKESLQKQIESNPDFIKDVSKQVGKKQIVTDENKALKNKELKNKGKDVTKVQSVSPKKKKRNKIETSDGAEETVPKQKKKKTENLEKEEKLPVNESKEKPTEKLSKRQKRNLKKKNQNSEAAQKSVKRDKNSDGGADSKKSVFDTKDNDWNTEIKFGNRDKPNQSSNPEEKNPKNDFQARNQFNQNKFNRFERQRPNMKNHHLRKPKLRDNKEHTRRKPMQSTKLMINGMEIEVVMYDGFPVQKEDADRLKELKQQMILKG